MSSTLVTEQLISLTPYSTVPHTAVAKQNENDPLEVKKSSTTEQVRDVAKQMISYLENLQFYLPRWSNRPKEIALKKHDRESIKAMYLEHYDSLSKGAEAGGFHIIGKGGHTIVYTHEWYPHLVFKLFTKEAVLQQVKGSQKGREIIEEKHLFFVNISPTTCISLPEKTNDWGEPMALYVEELLPIAFSDDGQRELLDRILDYFDGKSSRTALCWFACMVKEAALLSQEFYYSDVAHRNYPLFGWENNRIDLFCTDFEHFENFEKKSPHSLKSYREDGLIRFFLMFPIPVLTEHLLNLALRYGLKDEISKVDFNFELTCGYKEYRARLEALKVYDARNWIWADESVAPFNETDLSIKCITVAKVFIDKIEQKMVECKRNRAKPLTAYRYFYEQPLKSSALCSKGFNKADVDGALLELKKQNVITNWVDWLELEHHRKSTAEAESHTGYSVYF